jgi:hypothetical protein
MGYRDEGDNILTVVEKKKSEPKEKDKTKER